MKTKLLNLFIFVISIFFFTKTYAQDVSINIVNIGAGTPSSPQSLVPQGSTGRIVIDVCNQDGGTLNAPVNKLRPLISLPASLIGATLQAVSYDGWSIIATSGGNSIRFENTATIAPGECSQIIVSYTGVNLGGPSTVTGTLGFNGASTIGNITQNDNSSTSISIVGANNHADVGILKTASTLSPVVGTNITFTLTASNAGPLNATNVFVKDVLPSGYTFVSATASSGTWAAPNWNIGDLANGANATLTIVATVNNTGVYANTAEIFSTEADLNITNNISTVTPVPLGAPVANLGISKIVDNATPNIGSNVTFTITANNAGPSNATNVIVNDVLPTGYTFVSATPSVGTWIAPDWTIGNLANGASATLTIIAKVNPTGSYANTATIKATENDPTPTNNSSTSTPTPVAVANVGVVKSVSDSTPNVGSNVTFTITANNAGPSNATNVEVNDILPPGYTFVSATPSAGTSWLAPKWTIGNLANGASAILSIVATVNPTGPYLNTAKISAVENDPELKDNEDTANTTPVAVANVGVLKMVNIENPTIGSNVIFTITANNAGPSNATNVVVKDLLPTGYTLVSASPSVGTWIAPDWTIGNLANGASATLTMVATVNATGPYANTATITATENDPTPGNNSSTSTPTPVGVANVGVSKTVNNPTPSVGSNVTFTIVANNAGPQNATNVVVNDVLPSGYTFVSATATIGTWSAPNWTVGNLANGATATLTIVATVNANGPYANTASITANESDPTPDNNTSTSTPNPVPVANVGVVKTASTSSPVVGTNITFRIVASNSGPSNATNVIVNDVLPSGYTFVSASPTVGTWSAPNWTIGNLANGASETLTIIATVNATGSYANTATIASDVSDPTLGNNTSTSTPTPISSANVGVIKTVNNQNPGVGSNVTFTITANNAGPSNATNVVVNDVLPAGYTFVSATPSVGTWTAPNWTIGNLANGATATLTMVATVNASGSYSNTATISANENDPTTGNNSSTSTPTPVAVANVGVIKTVSNTSPKVGTNVIFTIVASNAGPQTATNVIVDDVLPAGYTFVSANPSVGTWAAPKWMVGNLANGATATLTMIATVNPTGPYANTATISANENDPTSGNDSSTSTTTPIGVANVGITKTVSNTTPNVGNQVTFTLTANNAGPSTATNIVVTDQIPAGYTFVSATPSVGTWTNPKWTIPSLENGATASIAIVVKVNATGPYLNIASIDAVEEDPTPTNDTGTATTTPVHIIDAVDDYREIPSNYQGLSGIILAINNDTLNGSPTAIGDRSGDVKLTSIGVDPTGHITLMQDGTVNLAVNTPAGTYEIKYIICQATNLNNCDTAKIVVVVKAQDEVDIYNHITPNNDGDNEYLFIDGINNFPENNLEIYNRWGVLVYEVAGYNNQDKSFRGISDGRVTVNRKDNLPEGTYYYILKYKKSTETIEKSGYLYLNR